jgi:Tfp pilus assembly pilus retraction ATPase PilT
MQAGQEETGMQTMNQSLVSLVRGGYLSKQDAFEHSTMPEEMQKLLRSIPDGQDSGGGRG